MMNTTQDKKEISKKLKNTTKKFIIITAAYVEGIRLIDNIQFEVGATK